MHAFSPDFPYLSTECGHLLYQGNLDLRMVVTNYGPRVETKSSFVNKVLLELSLTRSRSDLNYTDHLGQPRQQP